MARVTILTYDRFKDLRTGVQFESTRVTNAEGHAVFLGVAEVPDEVAAQYYVGHPSFKVEGMTAEPTPVEREPVAAEAPAVAPVDAPVEAPAAVAPRRGRPPKASPAA